VAAPYGVDLTVEHERAVPPVVNDAAAVARLRAAALAVLGPDSCEPTAQSLGGEDFAWLVREVPGAMARLGVRSPGRPGPGTGEPAAGEPEMEEPGAGEPEVGDIHQGDFVADERAIGVGTRLLVRLALG